jgi:AAHS family 3-hydroxyphenylpropionic acid transporter
LNQELEQAHLAHADRSGRVVTLSLCAAAALFEGYDTQSMGVAAPRLLAEFGLNSAQAGWIFSAATLGLCIGAGLGGRAADLLGRKRTLIVSLLLFGLCSLLTAAASGTRALLLVRLLTGLGLGGAMPNFIAMASEAVEPARRLRVGTMVMAAMPVGGVLAGLMALTDRLTWNWRAIFLVGGVAPIVIALVMVWALPETAAQQRRRPDLTSVSLVLAGMDRARTTLLLWGGFFFTQLVLLLMLNWLPSLIIGLGFSHAQASLVSIGFNLSGAIGAVLLGRMHAGSRRRQWVLATYCGIALTLAAVALAGKAFALVVLACAGAGVFIVGAQLILFALAPLYYPGANRGTGVGAAVAAGRLGSVFGPLYAAALLAGGGGSATVLLGILPFVACGGAAAYALTWRAQRQD